jgi:hypothetical protein
MSELPLHRHYLHYSELPYSQRALYTATLLILGLGYLFALLNVYFTYAGRAGGNPLILSVQDIVVAYSGSGKGSRLESALRGPMSTMLPADERGAMMAWAAEGSPRAVFEKDIRPLLEKRCITCHDGSNPHLANFSTFDDMKKVTEKDTGATIATLVRVTHIHFFGLTFIFFIVGYMFSHAYIRPVWFKCTVVVTPFVATLLDVSSWYFTKLYHPFAWVVILAGSVMAMSFAFMWVVIMYQMWLSKPPVMVSQREHGDLPIVGHNPLAR